MSSRSGVMCKMPVAIRKDVAILMLVCLTAACKALSLANAKEKGTNVLVIRSLDE